MYRDRGVRLPHPIPLFSSPEVTYFLSWYFLFLNLFYPFILYNQEEYVAFFIGLHDFYTGYMLHVESFL